MYVNIWGVWKNCQTRITKNMNCLKITKHLFANDVIDDSFLNDALLGKRDILLHLCISIYVPCVNVLFFAHG